MLLRWVMLALLLAGCAHPPTRQGISVGTNPEVVVPVPDAPREAKRVDFARDVRPIPERRCQHCHFPGGRMYEALPFDREETVHHLGEKLFTRIRTADEQRNIRDLLSQAP